MGKNLNSLFRNVFYNIILKNFSWLHRRGMLDRLWKWATVPTFRAKTKLFGVKAIMPSNYVFPLLARAYPTFNNPYLELVHQAFLQKKDRLTVVDIGAAIGDTFLFIYQNIPEAIDQVICVEGHPGFFGYLKINAGKYDNAIFRLVVLSDKKETIPELIRSNESSHIAIGETNTRAEPLDDFIPTVTSKPIDVIKIDVDGFDGRVLNGARNILSLFRPAVIFEYHPIQIQATANDLMQPFTVLEECKYETLVWFDKWGAFSHINKVSDKALLKQFADDCLKKEKEDDIHFDVIALPADSKIDIAGLQACEFSKRKKFFY